MKIGFFPSVQRFDGECHYNAEATTTKSEKPYQEKKSKIEKFKQGISKPSSVFRSNFVEDHPNRGQNDGRVALTDYFSGDAQDEKCRCMMEKTLKRDNNGHLLYSCIPCGKEAINTTLKRHIESNLLEGISIPCNYCEKTFRSRHARCQSTAQ